MPDGIYTRAVTVPGSSFFVGHKRYGVYRWLCILGSLTNAVTISMQYANGGCKNRPAYRVMNSCICSVGIAGGWSRTRNGRRLYCTGVEKRMVDQEKENGSAKEKYRERRGYGEREMMWHVEDRIRTEERRRMRRTPGMKVWSHNVTWRFFSLPTPLSTSRTGLTTRQPRRDGGLGMRLGEECWKESRVYQSWERCFPCSPRPPPQPPHHHHCHHHRHHQRLGVFLQVLFSS